MLSNILRIVAWAHCGCVLVLCLCAGGCVSTRVSTREKVVGTYFNVESGGFIEFCANGRFYYSFLTPPLSSDGHPRNMGQYFFQHAGDDSPILSVRSAHAGQFTVRFSKDREKLFLHHPTLSPSEIEYHRQPGSTKTSGEAQIELNQADGRELKPTRSEFGPCSEQYVKSKPTRLSAPAPLA
jgi:hypothetical protein